MFCPICQKFINYTLNNRCPECGSYIISSNYNQTTFIYECPDCKGKFNTPSYGCEYTSINLYARCPWCGREMKGL